MAKKRKAADAAKQKAEEPEDIPEQQENPSGDGSDDEPSSSGGSGSDGSSGSDSDGSSAPEVSDEEQDEDDEDGEAFDEVNVDFQFFDPKEIDFHGLKALLHTYLDGEQYDGSGLADTIIAQSTVGTVVKTGEDDDPIAVMTALSTSRYAAKPFMGQVRDYVLSKCGDAALRRRFEEAWGDAGTALMLNERLINAPPALAPPLMQALLDEVAWATEDEPTQELRDSFKLRRYVLVTRVYSDPEAEGQQQQGGGGGEEGASGSKQKKKKKAASGALIVYVRPEDEFLHARADASFTWPIENRAVAKDELRPLRLALLFTADAAKAARAELDRVVGNAAAMAPPAPAAAAGRKGAMGPPAPVGGKGKAAAAKGKAAAKGRK